MNIRIILSLLVCCFARQDFSKFYRQILFDEKDAFAKSSLKNQTSLGQFFDYERNRRHRREMMAMVANLANGPGTHNNAHALMGLKEYKPSKSFTPQNFRTRNNGQAGSKYNQRQKYYIKHFFNFR